MFEFGCINRVFTSLLLAGMIVNSEVKPFSHASYNTRNKAESSLALYISGRLIQKAVSNREILIHRTPDLSATPLQSREMESAQGARE